MVAEETYLKDYRDGTMVVTYEGSTEDIEQIRDFVKHMYDKQDTQKNDKAEEDLVNSPSHYVSSGIECIYEMILLFGLEDTLAFCKLNSWKYRKRAMDKGGKQDMEKSDKYIKMYTNLKDMNDYSARMMIRNKYKDYLSE